MLGGRVLDALASHCGGLGPATHLVDVGAGLGRPLLHALALGAGSPPCPGSGGACPRLAARTASASASLRPAAVISDHTLPGVLTRMSARGSAFPGLSLPAMISTDSGSNPLEANPRDMVTHAQQNSRLAPTWPARSTVGQSTNTAGAGAVR